MAAQGKAPQPAAEAPSDLLAYGRSVITIEAEGLKAMSAALDERFAEAVALLVGLRGRVIATGIGKSGYVARKVAATLASTGTPAAFVHPAEAAHGDLGMLMASDAVLAFSNSGETSELQPILTHAAKLGLPVIGIGAREHSMMMRHAQVALLMPQVDEACPDKLAPTTSTVMMMALGDALALGIMRVRGGAGQGFEELHPGGAIGRRLMRVAAVMHRGAAMPIVEGDSPMRDVIVTMTGCSFGIAGVIEGGRLVGVITDGDLRRHLDSLLDATAREVMTPDPVWVSPGALVEDALALLNKHAITAMFAVEDAAAGRPVGIVHVHDFLRLGLA